MPIKTQKTIFLFFTLFLLGVKSFSFNKDSLLIQFKPVFHDKELVLNTQSYFNKAGDTISISKFRFYASSVTVLYLDGSIFSEKNSYHLLDASESSTLFLNVHANTAKQISSVSFNIGVDSLTSVSGALDGDLDPAKGMYWAWNSGYINAKLEGNVVSKTGNREIEFHIGGYMKPYYAIREVKLKLSQYESFFIKEHLTIIADVSAWFENTDLKTQSRIVTPGAEAMKMADNYINMFRIEN